MQIIDELFLSINNPQPSITPQSIILLLLILILLRLHHHHLLLLLHHHSAKPPAAPAAKPVVPALERARQLKAVEDAKALQVCHE